MSCYDMGIFMGIFSNVMLLLLKRIVDLSVLAYLPFLFLKYKLGHLTERQLQEYRAKELFFKPNKRPHSAGRCIWFHAASVGELNSILPLIEKMPLSAPNDFILVTTLSSTSAHILSERLGGLPHVYHHYFPLDLSAYVQRFLNFWQPHIAIFVESQIWPNMLSALRQRKVKTLIINGRMSPKSFRLWKMFSFLFTAVLEHVDIISQDRCSARRFESILSRKVKCFGNLKCDAPALPVNGQEFEKISRLLGGGFVIVASSFHPGEEAVLFKALPALKAIMENVSVILAPRHPQKRDYFLKQAHKSGLFRTDEIRVRSRGELPTKGFQLYVADTIGELGMWYTLADMVVMGGTFLPHGGQNPMEPALFGKPIIAGVYRSNFEEMFSQFEKSSLACAHTSEDIVKFAQSLTCAQRREHISAAILSCAESQRGGLEKTLGYIMAATDD